MPASFECVVSTAKESIRDKPSTMIGEGGALDMPNRIRWIGKLIYTDSLTTKDRYDMHDVVATSLDNAGEQKILLGDTLQTLILDFRDRGIIKEGINLGERDYSSGGEG